MAAGHEFRSCTIELVAGAAFVLCTDGVTEAMDHEGCCYGLERLEAVLREPAPTAAVLGQRILSDIDRHTAGALAGDDICLVCVHRQG
jgi:serine phosphatase RsbU (regulator of sigma subunit)